MILFIIGLVIFCFGIFYRLLLLIEKDNDIKIINSETKTITEGME